MSSAPPITTGRRVSGRGPIPGFIALTASLPSVPLTPDVAATQIRTCVRTALLSGRRLLNVDVLHPSADPSARLFDANTAHCIVEALTSTLTTASLPGARVQIITPASTIARVSEWSMSLPPDIRPDVVDLQASPATRGNDPMLVLNPPARGGMLALRAHVSAAQTAGSSIIVHNLAREDMIYQALSFGGSIPRELWLCETAYVIAPFAIQKNRSSDSASQSSSMGMGMNMSLTKSQQVTTEASENEMSRSNMNDSTRFVLMRQFPDPWQLWRFVGARGVEFFGGAGEDYILCQEFERRPSSETLSEAIKRAM